MNKDDQESLDLQHSLEAGLRRANEVEETISEIKGILTELDETIKGATASVVSISLDSPRRTRVGQWLGVLEYFRKEFVPYSDPEDRDLGELEVLAKITPTTSHADTRKICSMTMSEEGYPVTVDSGTHVEGCYDAESLKRCLAKILSRSTTGRKLRALMQRHQEREAQQQQQQSLAKHTQAALKDPNNPGDQEE
jgi:hypothetical protein